MDRRRTFSDSELRQEFLDRFSELAPATDSGGLESLSAGQASVDDAQNAIESMSEGTWQGQDPALEAIIERFTRPVQLVQDNTFKSPPDDLPNSEVLQKKLEAARTTIETRLPSVGRINLQHHRQAWVGTGWVVAPGVVATNRHVADNFATAEDGKFVFRKNFLGPDVKADIDWLREHARSTESVFRVREVLWIEPDSSFDVALLRIAKTADDDQDPPEHIPLATQEELDAVTDDSWMAVVGYPAHDSRNRADDQQRIFDGIYNVKRLSPGQITAVRPDGLITHDATTLGGNSGSSVIDLASGKALALHFGGSEGEANWAVQAPKLAAILKAHVS